MRIVYLTLTRADAEAVRRVFGDVEVFDIASRTISPELIMAAVCAAQGAAEPLLTEGVHELDALIEALCRPGELAPVVVLAVPLWAKSGAVALARRAATLIRRQVAVVVLPPRSEC